jgi:hypothetical protein
LRESGRRRPSRLPVVRTAWRLAARDPVDRSQTPDARAGAGASRYTLVPMDTRTIAIAALVIAVVVVIILFVL